jgi:hypothetical protein
MWATFADVAERWVGPGAPTNQTQVETLIEDAEQVILSEFPKIQDRIDAELLPVERVKMVVVQIVTRFLRNPEGLSSVQQTTGPFSQSRSFAERSSGLALTDSEIKLLAPTRGKAFEINLGVNAVAPAESYWVDGMPGPLSPVDPAWNYL